MTELPTVPVAVRVHLAHATVQAIADEVGADILHIKGPSVDPSLRPEGRSSVDADVLVRPSHLDRFLGGLRRRGWQEVIPLRNGGLVRHSANWYHGELGQMDIHVRFPGIQIAPEVAFERLWQGRTSREIAHRPCVVPEVAAQRLIVLLHTARDVRVHSDDVRAGWTTASVDVKADVWALARALRAEVALSVVTGDLERFRDRPEYSWWRLKARGTDAPRATRLIASLRATPAGIDHVPLRVVAYAGGLMMRLPHYLRERRGAGPSRCRSD